MRPTDQEMIVIEKIVYYRGTGMPHHGAPNGGALGRIKRQREWERNAS